MIVPSPLPGAFARVEVLVPDPTGVESLVLATVVVRSGTGKSGGEEALGSISQHTAVYGPAVTSAPTTLHVSRVVGVGNARCVCLVGVGGKSLSRRHSNRLESVGLQRRHSRRPAPAICARACTASSGRVDHRRHPGARVVFDSLTAARVPRLTRGASPPGPAIVAIPRHTADAFESRTGGRSRGGMARCASGGIEAPLSQRSRLRLADDGVVCGESAAFSAWPSDRRCVRALSMSGRAGFQPVVHVSLRVRLPHDASLNFSTSVDALGRTKHTAYGTTYVYGTALDPAAHPRAPVARVKFEKYVLTGRVVDVDGKPVEGAAIRVGGDVVFTDSDGAFSSAQRRSQRSWSPCSWINSCSMGTMKW